MRRSALLISVALIAYAGLSSAQESRPDSLRYPSGISIEYGYGRAAIRDEYISEEKYTGTLPSLGLKWSRAHGSHMYFLSAFYRESSDITNHNVSTDIIDFSLNQGFLYPLSRTTLFSQDLFLYIGPTAEIFLFYNKPRIAVSGFDYAQSLATLISVGIRSEAVLPLSNNFQLEGDLQFGVLSFGVRMVDEEEEDVSPAKILTPLAGTHAILGLGLRYFLTERFSLKAAFEENVTRISSWEPLLSASDSFFINIGYGL